MTLTIDSATYNELLAKVSPKVIESETEYDRALSIVEELLFKKNRTSEETAIYLLLVTLIESYEAEHYPIHKPSPDVILRHILESSGTHFSALVGTVGSEREVKDILSGSSPITESQATILSDRYKVSPDLFLP